MPSSDREKPLVLVIDDDFCVREIVQRILVKDGMTVLLAASGAEGLDLARAHLPDLIVLDVVMPGENGFDLLTGIKAEPAISGIPVIIFTLLSVQYREKAERLGAVAYIPKPFDMRDIVQTIRKFL